MELLQLVCGLLVLYGAALCFAGYRIFRACLGAAGLVVGVVAGLLLADELVLHGLARWLIVAGLGLLGAVLAAAVYYAGVFIMGGLAFALTAAVVATQLDRPLQPPVLAGILAAGGTLSIIWHKKLIIYATALVGALIILAGLAPLVLHTSPPEAITVPWLQEQVGRLPTWWLGVALGLAVVGGLAQQAGHRRRYGLGFASATSHASLAPAPEDAPRRRSRAKPVTDGGRTHGAICPRCGSIVDVDALLCHQCGNDRWD